MTPQQRANAYWDAQRKAEDCSLVEWFKRCENDALERAAVLIEPLPVADRIRLLKHKVA